MNDVRRRQYQKADINDVANWFLLKGAMSHKKLQKLCYYAEAWSEALLDDSISKNCDFQAWVHGPVNKILWDRFKEYGWNAFELIDEEAARNSLSDKFTEEQLDVLEAVWNTYHHLSADQLEAQTHKEEPWLEKRKGLGKFQNSSRLISKKTMKDYYRTLMDEQA